MWKADGIGIQYRKFIGFFLINNEASYHQLRYTIKYPVYRKFGIKVGLKDNNMWKADGIFSTEINCFLTMFLH